MKKLLRWFRGLWSSELPVVKEYGSYEEMVAAAPSIEELLLRRGVDIRDQEAFDKAFETACDRISTPGGTKYYKIP